LEVLARAVRGAFGQVWPYLPDCSPLGRGGRLRDEGSKEL